MMIRFSHTTYRVAKMMKAQSLVNFQIPKHAYRKATQKHVSIANTLSREFNVNRPNEVWCRDITHIWTGPCWAYLALVMDLFAQKPVGWAISLSPNSQLTGQTLSMAYEQRGRPNNVMFHDDQGCPLYEYLYFDSYFGITRENKA